MRFINFNHGEIHVQKGGKAFQNKDYTGTLRQGFLFLFISLQGFFYGESGYSTPGSPDFDFRIKEKFQKSGRQEPYKKKN
jgi:hypothetical protein